MATATLTPKQALFVAEYLVDRNGKQAAIRAGYSPRSAEMQASRLRRIDKVQAAIAQGQAERLTQVKRTADDVVFLLEDQAFANRAEMWGTDPQTGGRCMKHPLDWPESLQRCIKSFNVVTRHAVTGDGHVDTVWTVTFVDPLKAAVSLGEHYGIFEKDRRASSLNALIGLLQDRRSRL